MLKSKVTKDEHAALPEAVQAHYKAEGDAFVLDADGLVSQADLNVANQKVVECPREQPGTECQGDRA